jgi:hypothetical protein
MTILRAHFDGRVLVPDEPVDLPKDRPLVLSVQELVESPKAHDGVTYFDINPETGLPVFRVPQGAKAINVEAIRDAMDEFP